MKKLFKLGLGLFFAAALVACGGEKEDIIADPVDQTDTSITAVYQLDQPGVSMTMTIVGQDDKVIKQITSSTIEYAAIGAETAEEAKQIIATLTNSTNYASIKGVDYDMQYGETSAKESITVDMLKADLKELAALPGSAFDGDPTNGISFKATGMLLENSGFKKVD